MSMRRKEKDGSMVALVQPGVEAGDEAFRREQKAAFEASIPIPPLDLSTDPTIPPDRGGQEGVRVEPLQRAQPPPNADDVGRMQLRAFEDDYLLYSDRAIRIPAMSRAEVTSRYHTPPEGEVAPP